MPIPAKVCLLKVTLRAALLLASCGIFAAGCDRMETFRTDPGVEVAPVVAEIAPASPDSLALVGYYARVEEGHRSRGLLRIDGGGPDVPYDADRLASTFTAVAFAREFTDLGPALVQSESASKLHRWETPIQLQTLYGASVPDMQRADDSAAVQRYAARLKRITRHPVEFVERGGNFHVLILTEDERRVVGPMLTRLIPGIRPREIDLIETLDRANYCVVVAADPKNDGAITRAVAVIRAELPPLLRLSCIHEEVAQGLGLSNDSATARPSIFNDDDEFGRLTGMDEKMLQMLYDLRLSPGMDAETAAPIVETLARSLTASTL